MDEQRFLGLMEQMIRSIMAENLQRIEERLDRMDARFQQLEEHMDGKLQQLEERMDGKLQQLEDRLTAKIDDVRMDIAAVSARVDLIKEAVDSLEESMTDVKKVLIYLQDKWVEHDREIWQLKRKA